MIAARPEEPSGELVALRSLALQGRRIALRPLSQDGSRRLTARSLGDAPSARFVEAAHELTGGNPFLIHALLLELARERVEPSADNVGRVLGVHPDAVRSAVLLRLAQLPEAARAVAEAVSVLGAGASLRAAAVLAKLEEEDAVDAVERLVGADILTDRLPLEFVHPIVRSVVYAGISSARRSGLHLRAAELAEERGEHEAIGHHLLATEPRGDSSVAEKLELAAGAALSRGAPDEAAAHLRRALAEPPAGPRRGPILAMLGQAEAATRDDRAPGRVAEALELVADPAERAGLQLRLGLILYAAGRPHDAAEAFRRGREELGEDSEHPLGAALTTSHLAMGTLTGSATPSDFAELIARARQPAPGEPLGAADREVLVQLALAHVHAGTHDLAGEFALRAVADGQMLAEQGVSLSFSVAASCVLWADAVGPAEEVADDALRHARATGDPTTSAYALFGRAQPRYWRGALAEAAVDAGAAVEAWRGGWGMGLSHAGHWHAVSLLELGREEEAAAALEASAPDPAAEGPHDGAWHIARARVALARGDLALAREELRIIEAVAARAPFFRQVAYWPWRGDAAIAARLDGDLDEAARLAGEELRLARHYGAPRPLGSALIAAGLVDGGEAGIGMLREAVIVLEGSPSMLERCRALVELGALLRRSGERSAAREPLRRGLDLAHRIGAATLERRAHDELQRAGARPRRQLLSGPDSLTPSERRVSELAAAGQTNREIAEQLFVSLRTVETHLTHSYGKLDISSRGELGAALANDRGSDHDASGENDRSLAQ
jgi:DNA-binding CsgD family transcriptional regulator